jgi:predicted ATPase
MTNKLSATMQIAGRVYSLAQEQGDAAPMIGAYRALATTIHFLGDFESTLSNRHNFVHWLAIGGIHRGWARIASGDTAEGISFIEHGIRDFRATGSVLGLPYHLAQKAEALHLADRTSEALEAINEAEALAEKFEQRFYVSELHRLRGVFLATVGADEMQIEASFCAALRIAREQKSIALAKVAEATYAAYCRQKANASGGRGFRLPLR